MRYSRLAHAIAGSRASSTRGQASLCPQCRLPRPRHPGQLAPLSAFVAAVAGDVGAHAALNLDLTVPDRDLTASKRGNCSNRGATRRRHADRMLLMVQNPHHYPWYHAPSLVQRCPGQARLGVGGGGIGGMPRDDGLSAPRQRLGDIVGAGDRTVGPATALGGRRRQ